MNILPVILWTDALVFVLVFLLVLFLIYLYHNPKQREPWRYVYNTPLRLIATLVLIMYASIGFLDSLHFRQALAEQPDEIIDYESHIVSVLDLILSPIDQQIETTYSAPFATNSFSMEMVESDTGISWHYPPLLYGGKHLQGSDMSPTFDILMKVVTGLQRGIELWVLGFVIFFGYQYYRKKSTQVSSCFPWKTLWAAILFFLCLFSVIRELMSHYHIFGTDKVGRDIFYAAVKSIRTGLVIGTITTLVMLPFALLLGTMAGYFRGWIDDVIQYIYTTLSSVPGVLLIAAAVLTLQVAMSEQAEAYELMLERTDLRLLILCVILGITSWTGLCRLLRGETLKLRSLEYVEAARALGVGHFKIIIKHIIPNLMHIIFIAIALDFSGLVLAEAVLSYVGVGVDPSSYSWGNMINAARLEMAREPIVWWSLVGAFIMMFSLVLAANVFADAVRDAFDPRSR